MTTRSFLLKRLLVWVFALYPIVARGQGVTPGQHELCLPPDQFAMPAAGPWRGSLRFVYEAGLDANFDVIYTMGGDLSFQLAGAPLVQATGTSKATLQISRGPLMPATQTVAGGANEVTLNVGGEARMDLGASSPTLSELRLTSTPANVSLGVQVTELTPEGRVRADGQFRTGDDSTIQVTTPDGDTRTVRVPVQQPQPVGIAILKIQEGSCGTLSGTLDVAQLTSMQQAGLPVRIVENTWSARLEGEQDSAYAERVQAFIAAPIPTALTEQYVAEQQRVYLHLQAEATTDYKRCILESAKRRMYRLALAAYEQALRDFLQAPLPAPRPGAAYCERFMDREGAIRLETMERQLQLLGLACPALDWRDVAGEKIRQELRRVLPSPHTIEDIMCFERMSQMQSVDFQDLAGPLAKEMDRLQTGPQQPK